MTTITREEALRKFGPDLVEGAELATLMRNDRPNAREQTAQFEGKWWRFVPRRDQLETMAANR